MSCLHAVDLHVGRSFGFNRIGSGKVFFFQACFHTLNASWRRRSSVATGYILPHKTPVTQAHDLNPPCFIRKYEVFYLFPNSRRKRTGSDVSVFRGGVSG